MGTLNDLDGVKAKVVDCEFINKVTDVKKILNKGLAATTAGRNGAINIWKDDDGNIRCESMAYCRSLEKKVYMSITYAEKWCKRWLKLIN